MERRLSAILAADAVGYSRLMALDEAGTLAALTAHRTELIEPLIAEHGGRVVKLIGDGLLAEFASVVQAVTCAIAIQRGMAPRNEQQPKDRRIDLRIGVNLGDVIVDGDDIYGDGVNVAARLEGMADPGGVCLSRAARDQVRDKLDIVLDDLGEVEVKNLPRPVRAFRVVLEGDAQRAEWRTARQARFPPRFAGVVAVLGIALAVGMFFVFRLWNPVSVSDLGADLTPSFPQKPSIAVLPFSNLSSDSEQEYFADGITDDLITDLSKVSGLFVIARNSSFAYKDQAVDIKQVGADLGVRYVLEGSVRRVGDSVRINAQLVDAQTGGSLWAERYVGAFAEVFALQDRVTKKIVAALAISLSEKEQIEHDRRETQNPEAYDAFLRGWSHYRRDNPEDFAKAIPYFQRALELDPDYGRAHAALAALYWTIVDKNWSAGTSAWSRHLGISTEEVLKREAEALQEALKNPDALAYRVASGRYSRQGRHLAAIEEAERAISLDPNDPVAHEAMATALIYAGRSGEGEVQIRQAMRLDPRFSMEYLFWLGLAQFGLDRFEDAADTLRAAAEHNPDDDRSLIVLAAAYGHLGRKSDAESAVEKADRLRQSRQQRLADPDAKAGINALLIGPYTLKDIDLWPFKEPADRDRLRQGLRLAGVPESGQADDVSPREVEGAVTIDAAEAMALFERGVPFVDVRGTESWDSGHIPRAVHLNLNDGFTESALGQVAAKDQELVIYCMGPRCLLSSEACAMAISWGFQRIYYFREGFPSWKAAGFPVAVPQPGSPPQ